MAKEKEALISFAERSKAVTYEDKLKLILLAAGVKPATFIHLKIDKNLHDRHIFEDLLKSAGLPFKVGRAKGYEEMISVSKKRAKWRFKGTWYGYDIFRTEKDKKKFEQYVSLVKQRKHKQADLLAGEIYGYPKCCVKNFIKEHNKKAIAKTYTYYEFYKRLRDAEKAFPFIQHTACSTKCRHSSQLNKQYKAAVKKHAKTFYYEYTKKTIQKTPLIIDGENDILINRKSIWKEKDGHDYVLVNLKPINKKYFLMSWLTKKKYLKGTLLVADVAVQYDFATVKNIKEKGIAKDFHHERHFRT